MALETQQKRGYLKARRALASLLFLFVLALPSVRGAENDDPWEFLSDFQNVKGAIRRVDERYVAALFYHGKNQLSALVIFPSSCEGQRCSLEHPVAYSVFDARGLVIRSHEEKGENSLLQRILTSASPVFTAA